MAAESYLPSSGHVRAELVAEFSSVQPGTTSSIGLRLIHEPHWHTYWIVPGDAGLPTQIRWKQPTNLEFGPLQWPIPQLLRVGPLANYGYEGTVLLPLSLSVPVSAREGSSIAASAHAAWLVCSDVCIPESAELELTLPVRKSTPDPGPLQAEFAAARVRIPQPRTLQDGLARIDGERIRLQFASPVALSQLSFFPLEASRIQAAAPQRLTSVPGRTVLDLAAEKPVQSDFKTLRGVLVADGGPGAGTGAAWAGIIELPLKPAVLHDIAPAASAALAGAAGATGARPSGPATSSPSITLWVALLGAFLGGLILNLMPCVFPILSLKLLSLAQHRHRGDPSLAAHGLAFTSGSVASFVALAALLVALRSGGSQLGWGFQLQSPLVVALLTALFFGIGLNLLGAFEVSLGTSLMNSKAVQGFDAHHLRGSFATGALAVVVASPCTAPFMGAALGFAIAAPAAQSLGVFAMLGLGMATPYLSLTLAPSLLARLPRPGAWMERLRQLMAFPMFITCVWLLWVLAQQVDVDALGLVLGALVVMALAAWAAGQAQRGSRSLAWVGAVAMGISLLAVVSATTRGAAREARPQSAQADLHGWAEWSPTQVSKALAAGRPVFVDFTAAWCVTCQANKRLVLFSPNVSASFQARGVTRLRADWTNRNEAIGRELARFQRSGVPLYLLYDAQGQPHVLPEILTESIVLDALSRI